MRYSRALLATGALALAISIALPAGSGFAAGSGGSSGGGTSSGWGNSTGSGSSQYDAARAKVEAEDYRGAMPMLEKLLAKNPRDADVLNLMGYSTRKLGNPDKALDYYQKALAIDPRHIGANEYLGELYLEMKDLPKAEERLQVLTGACNGCEEQQELEEKIAAYKAENG